MKIPEEKIEENLKNIELGKDLTLNLAVLNGEFKKRYFKCKECGKPISEWNMTGYCTKCYYKSEEWKKKKRENNKKPEVRKRIREYMKEHPMPDDENYSEEDLIEDITNSSGFYCLPNGTKEETRKYVAQLLNDLIK